MNTQMATELPPAEVFAVDFAQLAREIAMDILPFKQILELHRLSDEEWQEIAGNPKFRQMLDQMTTEWNATNSVKERIKVKAQTGLESQLEVYIRDIGDTSVPLTQRVEAGKFLARLGELDGQNLGGGGGVGFQIVLNIGTEKVEAYAPARVIEGAVIPEVEE